MRISYLFFIFFLFIPVSAYGQTISDNYTVNASKEVYSQFIPLYGTFNILMDYSLDLEIHRPKTIEAGGTSDILITPKAGTVTTSFFKDEQVLGVTKSNLDLGKEDSISIPETIIGEVFIFPKSVVTLDIEGPANSSPQSADFAEMKTQKFSIFVNEDIKDHSSIEISIKSIIKLRNGGNINLSIAKIPIGEKLDSINATTIVEKIPLSKDVPTELSFQLKDGTQGGISIKPILVDNSGNLINLNTYSIDVYTDGKLLTTIKPNQWSSDIQLFEGTHNIQIRFSDTKDENNVAINYKSSESKIQSIIIKPTNNNEKITSSLMCPEGTFEQNGICIQEEEHPFLGGCLIATATYGSELAPQVQQLRELRDNKLLQTESGAVFMESFNVFYYSFSPEIADYERKNPYFKEAVKLAITPMISSLSILNYVDMDSEVEVLGIGISLILFNIGMYVGVPVAVFVGIRKNL